MNSSRKPSLHRDYLSCYVLRISDWQQLPQALCRKLVLNELEQRDTCEGLTSCKLVVTDLEQRDNSGKLATCSAWLSERQSHRLREEAIAASFSFLEEICNAESSAPADVIAAGMVAGLLMQLLLTAAPMRTCPSVCTECQFRHSVALLEELVHVARCWGAGLTELPAYDDTASHGVI